MSKCAGFLCSKVTASTLAAAALPGLLVLDFGGRFQPAVCGWALNKRSLLEEDSVVRWFGPGRVEARREGKFCQLLEAENGKGILALTTKNVQRTNKQ